MPEGGVIATFEHQLLMTKRDYERKHKRVLTGVLQLHPCTFTLGQKKRPYTTAVADRDSDYTDDMDACPPTEVLPWQVPSPMDLQRSKKRGRATDFAYLVRPRSSGPVNVQARGKILAVSAGYHAAFVLHTLEAHWVQVTVEDYAALRQGEINGPNPSRTKAARMRSYRQLDKFIEKREGDTTEKDNTVVMLLAVVTDDSAWILVDFARLARVHIVTRGTYWTADDLALDAQVWTTVLGGGYGPDWAYQRPAAIEALDAWRIDVMREHTEGTKKPTYMFQALSDNQSVFNGFGQHTANDVLHLLGIDPLTPTWAICESDTLFHRLRGGLETMTDEWHSPAFLYRVAAQVNSDNPFSYQYHVDQAYKATYVHVYRKIQACVRANLYPQLAKPGLLDPLHTIGKPYECPYDCDITKHIMIPVFIFTAGTKESLCYSVIQAQLPEEWGLADVITMDPATEDFRDAGGATTLGSISFHNKTRNMLHLGKQKIKGKVGKPKIEYTGKRGQPKKPKTVAQLEALRVKKSAPVVPLEVKQARRSAKVQAAKNLASSVEHRTTRSASKRERAMSTLDINSPSKRVKSV